MFISVVFFFFCFFFMLTAPPEPTGEKEAGRRRDRERERERDRERQRQRGDEDDDGEWAKMVSDMSGRQETGDTRGKGDRDGRTHGWIEAERVSVCRSSPKQ